MEWSLEFNSKIIQVVLLDWRVNIAFWITYFKCNYVIFIINDNLCPENHLTTTNEFEPEVHYDKNVDDDVMSDQDLQHEEQNEDEADDEDEGANESKKFQMIQMLSSVNSTTHSVKETPI